MVEIRTVALAGACLLSACAFDAGSFGEGGSALGSTGGGASSTNAVGSTTVSTASTTNTTAPVGSTTQTDTDPPTAETTDGPSETSDEDPGSSGEPPDAAGCPSRLPEGWIACRDFEQDLDGFAAVIGDVKHDDEGFISNGALRFDHTQGENWAGAAILRFGNGPAADNVAETGRDFDEVWLRLHTRTSDQWSTHGHGDLVHLGARTEGNDWPRGYVVTLDSVPQAGVLSATAFSCVFGDNIAGCTGSSNDWNILQARGGAMGSAPYATPADAGQWRCVTLHARLNTPGQFDGVLELSLDGEQQVAAYNIDYRGSWDEVGFNTLTLPSWWPSPGPPSDTERSIDNIVLSTKPLTCD